MLICLKLACCAQNILMKYQKLLNFFVPKILSPYCMIVRNSSGMISEAVYALTYLACLRINYLQRGILIVCFRMLRLRPTNWS